MGEASRAAAAQRERDERTLGLERNDRVRARRLGPGDVETERSARGDETGEERGEKLDGMHGERRATWLQSTLPDRVKPSRMTARCFLTDTTIEEKGA